MPSLTALKFIGVGILVLLVVGGAWMLRDELIDKGMNLVKAQDNAALVKAQADQAKSDALRIAAQNDYINLLQSSGNSVKEKIRVVPSQTCLDDGRSDPRVGDTVDWLRGGSADSVAPDGRPQPQAAMPATGGPAAKR
jgi:hypothetical protein